MIKIIISFLLLFSASTVFAKEIIIYRKATLSLYGPAKKKIKDVPSYSKTIYDLEKGIVTTDSYAQNHPKTNDLTYTQSKILKTKEGWIQEYKDNDGKTKTAPVKNIKFAHGIISSATVERGGAGRAKSIIKYVEDNKKSTLQITNYGMNGAIAISIEGQGDVITETDFNRHVKPQDKASQKK